MPHTSRRKPTKPTNRKIVALNDGWSTVTTSSRSSSSIVSRAHDVPVIEQDPSLTSESLQAKIEDARIKWVETPARTQLINLLAKNGFVKPTEAQDLETRFRSIQISEDEDEAGSELNQPRRVDNAILLALGSLSSSGAESWRSRFQLAVFLDLVSELTRSNTLDTDSAAEIKLYIQEPCLTALDEEVLSRSYDFTILKDSDALGMITDRTCLFVTCMEGLAETVYRNKAVDAASPLYITTDMSTVIERGEALLATSHSADRYTGDGGADGGDKDTQHTSDMVCSGQNVQKAYIEYDFPGHAEHRALPSAVYVKQ